MVRTRTLNRGLRPAIFTVELFGTPGDVQNRAAVRVVVGADLDLAGLTVHGPRNAVDKVCKGARMHPDQEGDRHLRATSDAAITLCRAEDSM